jgi:hypothetical protein
MKHASGPMMDLPSDDDTLILALDAEGLTRTQIAARLGVTRNVICGKLHRLRHRRFKQEPRGPMVTTSDFESENDGSIPSAATTPEPPAPMSRAEYLDDFFRRHPEFAPSKAWDGYFDYKLVAAYFVTPCGCGEPRCRGWAMVEASRLDAYRAKYGAAPVRAD